MGGSGVLLATLSGNLIAWWLAQVLAIAILVILFLRWRPGFTGKRTVGEMVNSALDAREENIRDQLEAAQRSREEAERIQQAAAADIERARVESREIVERARSTSEAIQEDMQRRAREEADRVVAQASAQINYEREQAELALQRRAADIVVDAARTVIQQNLDDSSDRRIIDTSLSDLKELR
jgi:F-type H+-transporting ATPase subunit b